MTAIPIQHHVQPCVQRMREYKEMAGKYRQSQIDKRKALSIRKWLKMHFRSVLKQYYVVNETIIPIECRCLLEIHIKYLRFRRFVLSIFFYFKEHSTSISHATYVSVYMRIYTIFVALRLNGRRTLGCGIHVWRTTE